MNIQKPLDSLNNLKGKQVQIDLKNRTSVKGKLISYDLNVNITIEVDGESHLIQGNTIESVAESK